MAYIIYMTFIETKVFTRQITELISDENYKALQEELIKHPKKGSVIVGGGGIRKIRWNMGDGRGKSGGIRTIYFFRETKEKILMLLAYPKNVSDNLSDEQLKICKTIAKEFENEE